MIAYDSPRLGDAEALDAMAEESWDETFAHLYRPEDLAAFKAEAFGPRGWLQQDLKRPDVRWQIARADDAIIGFVKEGYRSLLISPHLKVKSILIK